LRELDHEYYRGLFRIYRVKRDKICYALLRAKLQPNIPNGAYHVLADISALPGKNSKEQDMMCLLRKTGVSCVLVRPSIMTTEGKIWPGSALPRMIMFCMMPTGSSNDLVDNETENDKSH